MIRAFIIALIFTVSVGFFGCQADAPEPAAPSTEDRPSQPSPAPRQAKPSAELQPLVRADSSLGQTIYVPVYSHIYQQNRGKTFNLTATLSIRNSDIERPMRLTAVLYYDSKGTLIKDYLQQPNVIAPLASTSYVIEENDLLGGVGANFIVQWQSEQAIFPPVVEAVMISTSQQQGISFLSEGRVLQNQPPNASAP